MTASGGVARSYRQGGRTHAAASPWLSSKSALGVAAKAAPLQQLTLQGREEAFAQRVVVRIAHRAGRRSYAGLPAPCPERDRRVLRALVAVVNHFLRPSLPDGHVQRIQDQLGAQVGGHRPAHHPATPGIQHHRHVQKPRPRPYIGVGSDRSAFSPFERWVSPARPPNRTCDSRRIRLSMCLCRWNA